MNRLPIGIPAFYSSAFQADPIFIRAGSGLSTKVSRIFKSVLGQSIEVCTKFFLLSTISLQVGRAHAQPSFLKMFGGDGEEEIKSLLSRSNGRSIVGGFTNSFGEGDADALLASLGADGVVEWMNIWGGNSTDSITGLVSGSDVIIFAIGTTASTGFGASDIFLTKFLPNGTLISTKVLGSTIFDTPYGMVTASDGGILIVGNTGLIPNYSGFDAFVIKVWQNGTLAWAKTVGGSNTDTLYRILTTPVGRLIVCGETLSFGMGEFDMLLINLEADGVPIWAQTLGGTDRDFANGLSISFDSHIFMSGYSRSAGAGSWDFILSKWTSAGELIWAKTMGGSSHDVAQAMTEVDDGGLILSGWSYSFGLETHGLFIAKCWQNGTFAWAKILGSGRGELSIDLCKSSDGGFIVSGRTLNMGPSANDILIAKMTSEGQIYDCPYVRNVSPTISDVTNIFNISSPLITTQDWSTAINEQNWSTLVTNTISPTMLDQCLPSFTTGTVSITTGKNSSPRSPSDPSLPPLTTGTVPITTGKNSSPRSSSDPNASPSPASDVDAGIVVGISLAAFAVAVIALGVLGILIKKRRREQAAQQPTSFEMGPRIAAGHSLPSDREDARTRIGGKYELVKKISRDEAAQLFAQTGIEIEFPPNKNRTKPLIGMGHFGKIRIAITEQNEFVAVKKVKGADKIASSNREFKIQRALSDVSNVMPLLDSVETKGSDHAPVLYQFMPLAGFGSCELLQKGLVRIEDVAIKQKLLTHVAKSVLEALAGMHAKGIAHLDIKPSNIVIDQKGRVLIIDFGCATSSTIHKLDGGNGDTRYFSPSRIANLSHHLQANAFEHQELTYYSGIKADLWAFGITLLELFLGRYPLPDTPLKVQLNTWNTKLIMHELSPFLQGDDYQLLKQLIQKLLDADDSKVVSAAELLKDEIFSNVDCNFMTEEERVRTFKEAKQLALIHAQTEASSRQMPLRNDHYALRYTDGNGLAMSHQYQNTGHNYVNQ